MQEEYLWQWNVGSMQISSFEKRMKSLGKEHPHWEGSAIAVQQGGLRFPVAKIMNNECLKWLEDMRSGVGHHASTADRAYPFARCLSLSQTILSQRNYCV